VVEVEIDGFSEITASLSLAKELYDMGRYDMVQKQFCETLTYDAWYENTYGVITEAFTGFYSDYSDGNEVERMIFSDACISGYYRIAWEYGRSHNVPHDKNPFVIEAENVVRRWLCFSYSLDWALLGYTKTKKAADKSKLIVYTHTCEFCEYDHLAYGLLRLYRFFMEKCADNNQRQGVMAA
jgi:hypothetical protein